MFRLPKALTKVIESFERLPGIGPKTAQRLSFYLLHIPQTEVEKFAQSLSDLKKLTTECSVCFNIGETDPCLVCSDSARDKSIICVVEQPIDILSFEKTGKFNGIYHVLNGVLDPLSNIGPDEIRISQLYKRLAFEKDVKEIIIATNPNMEGEATAMYIQKQMPKDLVSRIRITRLAHGLPIGADLEYADEVTLTRALEGRREF